MTYNRPYEGRPAPENPSEDVLDHVHGTDELVFDRDDTATPLRSVYALGRIARIE